MVTQKQAIAGCALLLASSISIPAGDAFSTRSLISRRTNLDVLALCGRSSNTNNALMMAGFPPPMDGPRGPPGMGRGPPMGGPIGPGGPGPGMGGPPGGGGRPPQQQQGPGGGGPSSPSGGGSYNANNPPGGAFAVPNAGNTGEQPRARGLDPDARGLGAIASGVSTPMDKYGNDRPRSGGGYDDRGAGPNPRFEQRRWAGPSGDNTRGRDGYNEPGPRPDPTGPRPRDDARPTNDGRPNNLRYEERDYGEYVTNLRQGSRGGGGPPPPGGGGGGDYRDLEEEVERLRKENDLLKRSCQDLMGNFNDLSNRLFDVDESLKKVAKVFPSEEEMESLEWLLRR